MPHPYGWLSLLPPLIAILLAIASRRVVLSLLIGIFVGALITAQGDVVRAASDFVFRNLIPAFLEEGKLRVFSFTLGMGAMIGIIHRSGGMQGLIELVTPLARTRRSGQIATWLMGMVIFFDDYANSLLLGSTLRPICDRLRISREKLAYVVDSTAAPVAGLALVSTWVAVEIDYIDQGITNLADPGKLRAFDLFLASIPYRFYMLMSLLFIPLVACLGRDFGPMLTAERKRINDPSDIPDESVHGGIRHEETAAGSWHHAIVPVGTTLSVVLLLLYSSGRTACLEAAPEVTPKLRDIFGSADANVSLQYGALAGLLTAIIMARGAKLIDFPTIVRAAFKGIRVVAPAIAILWCATSLSRLTSGRAYDATPQTSEYQFRDHRLYTADYLLQTIAPSSDGASDTTSQDSLISPALLPTVVFLLASVVSFCTGTSFGTMGILMPMVISLSHAILVAEGGGLAPDNAILLATVASVLSGSVFGDHCSPISDTTVLSSVSSSCNHIEHVRTQLPYAMVVAGACIVGGTIPIAMGLSVWASLILQAALLLATLLLIGQKTTSQPTPTIAES